MKRYHVGIIIGVSGVCVAVGNVIFLQSFNSLNSVFLLYEGFAVIGLCLYAFYELVQNEREVIRNKHFWLSTIFLIYWSVVFVYWGMYYFLRTTLRDYLSVSTYVVMVVNILAYGGIAIIFWNYKKLAPVDG